MTTDNFNLPENMEITKESTIVKFLIIALITLGLIIPSFWVSGIVEERKQRQQEVINEVSAKWATSQTLSGPILRIPYDEITNFQKNANAPYEQKVEQEYFYLAPQDLKIDADVNVQKLSRSIFEVPVYNSVVNLKGNFLLTEAMLNNLKSEKVEIGKTDFFIGLTDLKGVEKTPLVTFHQTKLQLEPGSDQQSFLQQNLHSLVNLENQIGQTVNFDIKLEIKGTEYLRFLPMGKNTSVKMSSNWPDPKFNGFIIPQERNVSEKGFNADWNILHFNRELPQFWTSNSFINTSEKSFGADFYTPVDHYQLNTRSSKYSHLLIVLTFAALFLVEMIKNVRIHPIQYLLIGFALILYYSLLISFSEHVGFSFAYLIASVATTILVSYYSRSFLIPKKLSYLLMSILTLFYGLIFIIIKAQDTALLLGSIALFSVLAAIMYFSRNINWYNSAKVIEE